VPRVRREEEWALELLAKDNVLVQPGFFYDFACEAFLVLSLQTAPGIFQDGCLRLLARVEGGRMTRLVAQAPCLPRWHYASAGERSSPGPNGR